MRQPACPIAGVDSPKKVHQVAIIWLEELDAAASMSNG